MTDPQTYTQVLRDIEHDHRITERAKERLARARAARCDAGPCADCLGPNT